MATARRPKVGEVEERQAPLEADGKRIRGRIPYGTPSEDLGGFVEVIERTAFRNTRLDNLVAVVDHAGVPLARHPDTLMLEDRDDGLHWSFDPPKSREDIREAVERRDLQGASWRMVVGRDRWDGDTRHVEDVEVLRDVSVVTRPAYRDAVVELRNEPDPAEGQEDNMAEKAEKQDTTEEVRTEDARPSAGSLHVQDRTVDIKMRSLTEEFRSRGFPGEPASVSFDEFRAVTWGGTITALGRQEVAGVPLGADRRYAWQAVPQVAVNAGVTSVDVFQQTARTLPAGTAITRPIDATSAKPEVASTLNIAQVPLKQIAAIETNIPNVYLERDELATVVETDLTLAVYEGLDSLVLTGIATSGFQAPGTDNILVSIRKAMTTILASGYSPDTVILTPANSEAIDTMVSGISGGTADFVFGPGRFAPGTLFGLNVVISKTTAAPVVLDSTANGRLYASPLTLARFEVDAGSTNRSNIRLEGHAAYGVERTAAAVRIAAS
jgi:HK97 family phage prohead protease